MRMSPALKSFDLHCPPNFLDISAGSSVNQPVPWNPSSASVSRRPYVARNFSKVGSLWEPSHTATVPISI